MDDMYAKAEKEMQDEEVAFTKFKGWCTSTTKQKESAIKKSEELMEQLEADIAAADSEVVTTTDEIAALDAAVDVKEKEGAAATKQRAEEKALYHKTYDDYTESVESVHKAEKALSATQVEVPQSLLQTMRSNKLIPSAAVRKMASFLEGGNAPDVAGYEAQSGELVALFEDMEHEFKEKRNELEKNELEARHGYEMLFQTITDNIEKLKKQRGRKVQRKAQRQEDGATARGELKDTTATRDEDQKYLDDTVAGCEQKSMDFEARQKLRGEELVAINKAIEIIGGEAVSGSADKHLPAMVQSLTMLRAKAHMTSQDQVAEFLMQKATELNSKMLSMLADHAVADPFGKVRKMIKDMIVRLTEEAAQESEHKGWCDSELGQNKIQRDSKTEDVNSLSAKKDQLTADIAKLAQELTDLSSEMLELDNAVSSATELRTKENAKNTQTVKDAKAAQEAVKAALAVLKEFYAKAAEATALVQTRAPMDDAPSTFEGSFNGQQSESGGVIGMLEVIASDFARLESDTSAAEESGADEFKTFTFDSAVDKATMTADTDNKEKLKTRLNGELQTTVKDLKGAQSELDASLAYYDKLKPTCVDAGVSYEERVARREAEIQSLQEALKILSGEGI
jgi:peptidoglycan hydrolase CwlO-like protein